MSTKISVTYKGYTYHANPYWGVPQSTKNQIFIQKNVQDMFKVLVNIFKSCVTDPQEYVKYDMLPFADQQKIANEWYETCIKNKPEDREEPDIVY